MCKHEESEPSCALRLTQVFGGFPVSPSTARDDDLITSLKFNRNGDYLAVADRSHRIVVFADDKSAPPKMSIHGFYSCKPGSKTKGNVHSIEWLPQVSSRSMSLLTATDRTIQIWRLPAESRQNYNPSAKALWHLNHDTVIHSMAVDADGLGFLSADISTIKLHRFDRPDETLTFLNNSDHAFSQGCFTSATYHPDAAHLLAFGDNQGFFRLCDMRLSSKSSACIVGGGDLREFAVANGFPSSPSTVKFSSDGTHIMARDLLGEKVYDLRAIAGASCTSPPRAMLNTSTTPFAMDPFSKPTAMRRSASGSRASHVKYIMPQTLGRLQAAYRCGNSEFFDWRLGCGITFGNRFTATGFFNNTLCVHDRTLGKTLCLSPTSDHYLKSKAGRLMYVGKPFEGLAEKEFSLDSPLCHVEVHPTSNTVAMGVGASLCLVKIST
eukprot:TRINITY_DN2313_c0_g1::TRINITY_DN2313_c0_g1_i1::g.20866::m.20866 TRINITY_DN2313_c0_g1::TRINITY_DN2313_c0_g1_i1::g.20866  ORF type:complete len:438 (+),score=95.21,sp/Q7ZX64/2ABD_XENLA/25.33/6e-19,WD40/PF00400.27/4.3,WD40/PF00400.27/29,WD40/PF00400.27/4.3e+03,WD40/PF00400.27/3.2e+03,WD40/PF00400.27/1.2e+04,WD40/PF00400.27/5.5e+03 TRINITY_DN2313_c0_g1_i1:106-1419(+)